MTERLCGFPHHKDPVQAEYGNLCAWCWGRLHHDLADAPELTTHLRAIGQPHAAARPLTTDPIHRGDPAEQDPYPQSWHAADELHGDLASWALLILEEHPANLTGPTINLTAGRTDTDPTTGEPYTSDPRPTPHTGDTAELVDWMRPHLEWVAQQDWAIDMRAELGNTIATLKARWPTADNSTRPVRDVACPRCDGLTLTYAPPVRYRAPFVVSCINQDCGRIFSEDEWDAFVFHTVRKSA